MKTIYILVMFAAAFVALYEQSLGQAKNLYIMVAAILMFMAGLMRLMSKVPSKNERDSNGEV